MGVSGFANFKLTESRAGSSPRLASHVPVVLGGRIHVGYSPPGRAESSRISFHCRTSGRRDRVARAFSTVFGDRFFGRVPSEISAKAWRFEYSNHRYGHRDELSEGFTRIEAVLPS